MVVIMVRLLVCWLYYLNIDIVVVWCELLCGGGGSGGVFYKLLICCGWKYV